MDTTEHQTVRRHRARRIAAAGLATLALAGAGPGVATATTGRTTAQATATTCDAAPQGRSDIGAKLRCTEDASRERTADRPAPSASGGRSLPERSAGSCPNCQRTEFTPEQAKKYLHAAGYPATAARYGLVAYRLTYRTVDGHGRPTTASGLVAFPRSGPAHPRTVVHLHGTTPSKAAAPSVGTDDPYQRAGALSFAAAGFTVVAPDYLGLGTGPGRHPYLDTGTEVSATLDLLRAARPFAARHGQRLDPRLFVSGFSQGAHAALTVGRAVQEGRASGFRLGAIAPVSGAYDFGGVELPALLDGRVNPKIATLYAGYLLTSWNHQHRLYGSAAEVFRAPYASYVDDLYDGTHASKEVFERMPGTPEDLLTKKGMRLLTHPGGNLARALAAYDTSCTGWTPDAPTRLYYSSADREAMNANTLHCLAAFDRGGAHLPTVDAGPYDHTPGAAHAVDDVARWFTSLP